jgi:hypothetical protein
VLPSGGVVGRLVGGAAGLVVLGVAVLGTVLGLIELEVDGTAGVVVDVLLLLLVLLPVLLAAAPAPSTTLP